MHTFRKIRVSLNTCPKRFYRVMYVREDLNLFQISVTILTAFRVEFEHMFLAEDQKYRYVDHSWLDDSHHFGKLQKDYRKIHLKDLFLNSKNEFYLIYDTGDSWEFTVKLYKKTLEAEDEDDSRFGFVKEAKGDRIWEDYRYTFMQYLDGEPIDKDEDGNEYRPWNIPDDKPLSSFDEEIDLEELNDEMEIAETATSYFNER